MTKDFENFLKIYSAGITDCDADISGMENIDNVCVIAKTQNAGGFVCCGINKLFGSGYSGSELYQRLNAGFIREYSMNYRKRQMILQILNQLNKAGVEYKVIKGLCLGALYPDPVVRISSDVDLIADDENIEHIISLFSKVGFNVEEKMEESHHIVCRHPVAGMFEVHNRLYDECFDESWFDCKFELTEDKIYIDVDGVQIPTLGITDGLIYNYLHLIKHFLLTGTSMQQISDVLLYAKCYNDDINWDKAIGLFSELKYDTFFYGVLTIGTEFLGFSEKDFSHFCKDREAAEHILYDLEVGGVYGMSQRAQRDKFYHKYTECRFDAENKDISYKKYIAQKKHISIWTKVFSRKEILYNRYPFIKGKPWLLPIGCIMRWISGAKSLITGKVKVKEFVNIMPDEDNDVINQRIELVKKLKMM